MNIFKSKFILFLVFSATLCSISNCQWTRILPNPFQRKSWRIPDQSSEENKNMGPSEEHSFEKQCRLGSKECDKVQNEYQSLKVTAENSAEDLFPPQMTSKESAVQLRNGTTLFPSKISKQKLQNSMELIPWSDSNVTGILKRVRDDEFNHKMLQSASDESGLEIVSPNDTQARIIAYKVNVNTSADSAISRMTIGQLVSKSLFPDWVWGRIGMNRKIEIAPANLTRTRPVVMTATRLPSITFENNLNRFLKLFTVVRFENTPCVSSNGLNGTCYNTKECAELSGTAGSTCASGFGVCCIFQYTCGQSISRNQSYFVSAGSNFSTGLTTCNIQIQKATPLVKQMRLDFQIFRLQQPNAGSCEVDRFIVSGQNSNIPVLCGENGGSHLYVEIEGRQTAITLSVMTTGAARGTREWAIRVTQFETTNPSSAPSHCLQYHTGLMGTVRSFNYITQSSPQYLNNLNYAICIRKEVGFCSVTFSNTGPDGNYMPFQIVNANAGGHLVLPIGQAGVGIRDCPFDFILINGYRLCGERLNDATTNVLFVEDAPVTDTSNGPWIISVRTNELDVGAGFSLYYRQNPCISMFG